MAKLRKIEVFSTAKLVAVRMGLLGLIAGIFYSFGGFIYEAYTNTLNFGTVLAFGALIGMPIIFATFGFIIGAIGAYIYNLVAELSGK